MLNQRSDKLELIRIAEAVALEKAIDKDLILSSMESGIEKAAKSRFGFENNIKVTIDRSTGNIDIYRVLTIVENPINHNTEISLTEAKKIIKENEDKKILYLAFNKAIVSNTGTPAPNKMPNVLQNLFKID